MSSTLIKEVNQYLLYIIKKNLGTLKKKNNVIIISIIDILICIKCEKCLFIILNIFF